MVGIVGSCAVGVLCICVVSVDMCVVDVSCVVDVVCSDSLVDIVVGNFVVIFGNSVIFTES